MLRNTFVHLPGIGPRRERASGNKASSIGMGSWRGMENDHPAVGSSTRMRSWSVIPSRPWPGATPASSSRSCRQVKRGGCTPSSPIGPSSSISRRPGCPVRSTTSRSSAHWATASSRCSSTASTWSSSRATSRNSRSWSASTAASSTCPSCAHFPEARLDQAHIDLRFVLASLGHKGGLKAVERRLGLHRDPAIDGVDGFEAVRLWHRYRRGDKAALETLILYNTTDVVNLVELVEIAVDLKCRRLAFPGPQVPRSFPWPGTEARPEATGRPSHAADGRNSCPSHRGVATRVGRHRHVHHDEP